MIEITDLPKINAILNGTSALFILIGYINIRKEKKQVHKAFMIAALVISTLFLISYLIYHYATGHTVFKGTGIIKTVYLFILFSHIVLAAVVVPFVIITVIRAITNKLEKHKKIARWTFPIWLYVSVTGVIIYLMLYQLS